MLFVTLLLFFNLQIPDTIQVKETKHKKSFLKENAIDSVDNRQVEIENIYITGNKKTENAIILRELNFHEGELLSMAELQEIIKKDKNKITNTRLFNTVDIHVINISENKVIVLINVTERWYIFPAPIFELADRNFNEWWQNQNRDLSRTNYGLRLYHYNFRGKNDKLRATAQFGFTKRFDLSYSLPYFNKKQTNGLSAGISYSDNNSIAYKAIDNKLAFLDSKEILRKAFQTNITFTNRPSFYDFHTLSLSFERRWVSDTIISLNPNYFLTDRNSQQFLTLFYQYRRDYRDIAAYPLRGSFFAISAMKQGLFTPLDDINMGEISVDYAKFLDLNKNFFYASHFIGTTSFPGHQPFSNFRGMGFGQRFVRGYELYAIEGQNYFIQKNTIKKQLIAGEKRLTNVFNVDQFSVFPYAIYLKAYFDSGVVSNGSFLPENARLMNNYLFGGGIGLDIVTFYDNVFRIEYSINRQGERGFFLHFSAEL
jgi:outer membrane protein assembly factor BamA